MDNQDGCKTFHGNPFSVAEEKQQSTLTEWCAARENNSKLEPERPRFVPRAAEERSLLGGDGDTVFNQLVSFSFCWKMCLNLL